MKAEQINDIITVTEYFRILSKQNYDELTPKESSQKSLFENFINECELHHEFMTPPMQDVYSEYQRGISNLISKGVENCTALEQEAVESYQQKLEKSKVIEEMEEIDGSSRKLVNNNKSGYIDATIILVMILNIGFIIAMAILGNK